MDVKKEIKKEEKSVASSSSSYDDYSEWSEDPFLLQFNKMREEKKEKDRIKEEEKLE